MKRLKNLLKSNKPLPKSVKLKIVGRAIALAKKYGWNRGSMVDDWSWPQYVVVGLNVATTAVACVRSGEEKPREKYNGSLAIFSFILSFALLAAGGFFPGLRR